MKTKCKLLISIAMLKISIMYVVLLILGMTFVLNLELSAQEEQSRVAKRDSVKTATLLIKLIYP